MTKRQLRKAAYKAIVKENKSHQEAFDELSQDSSVDLDKLADELSLVPSPAKNSKLQTLRYLFIGILVLIVLLRIVGMISLNELMQLDPKFLILAVILGLFVPIYGIVGALTSRAEFYRTTSMLIALNLFRTLISGKMSTELFDLLFLIPSIIAVILGVYLPLKLRTMYVKNRIREEIDGVTKSRYEYVFENNKLPGNSELIDADLV